MSLLSMLLDKFMRLVWEKVDAPDTAIDSKPVPDRFRNHWNDQLRNHKSSFGPTRGSN